MSWWINSKAWQALLVFSCLSLYVGIKYLPESASQATTSVTKASFNKPPTTNNSTTSSTNQSQLETRKQSFDQTFDFSISTRLSVYPSKTEVHLIGVHQGDDGKKDLPWWSKCDRNSNGQPNEANLQSCHAEWAGYKSTETVKVNVNLSAPSILVLMANEPVIWTVKSNKPKLIKKVILAGIHAQQLKGIPSTTPIEISTQRSSPTCANCTISAAIPSVYDKSNKNYDHVLKAIKVKTGLEITTFQGSKKAGEFTISDKTPRASNQRYKTKYHLKEGDIIDKNYRHYFRVSNIEIPLPEGIWKGLIYQSIGKSDGEDQALVFYQQNGNMLQGIFAVRLKQSIDGTGFPRKNSCTDLVGYQSVVDINKHYGDQLCYWVEHVASPWETPLFELTAKRLEKRGFTVPSVLINSAFHKADDNNAVTSYYLTNPETVGITTQHSSWLVSPWHPRKIKSDDDKQHFVKNQLEWMDTWYKVLRVADF